MKRSRLLTIPLAAARMLLATLLLTMTAQTALATNLTSANLLIDSEIPEGTLGHFFSLMPKSGSATVDLTQSDVATLMIYDDGGKGGGYDSNTSGNFTPKANGYLLLHAPAGFQIHLTGHVRTISANAYLTVHNGNTESAPTLCANVHGEISSADSPSYKDVTVDVISTGEYMLLHFDAGALALATPFSLWEYG